MSGNTFGRVLRLTTFGESHGAGIGGVLDGCPAGLALEAEDLQKELDLRKPGAAPTSTKRLENDTVRLLSGVFKGKTTGTPIAFDIENTEQRSADYDNLAAAFRPGHADWSYWKKFKKIRDFRGGGRASARETAARVAGGAIAKKLLEAREIRIYGACVELGGIPVKKDAIDMPGASQRPYCAATDAAPPLWDARVAQAREAGDTLGGIVQVEARNVPAGLGEPVFDKISAVLAHGLMSVGAVKGIEIGEGFGAARLTGSANNDPLLPAHDGRSEARFRSNHAGGILGGITSGQDIVLRCAIKPIASINREQTTIDVNGQPTVISIAGRHDLSAIPRVIPVLTAMTALVLADALLLQTRMEFLA